MGREHVWVANADGTDPHEILADEPALAKGVFGLAWSPAGDRIAMENSLEGHVAIHTFAPDGSDFTEVITGGFNPHWSPDGSQIAYGLPGRNGVSVADADGSNVRTFGFGGSGPWHPGTFEERAEAPATPSPSTSPQPSTSLGFSRFTSTIHGISIDPPSGWQTRPATEAWTGEALDFDSPAADVIFDPTLRDDLYIALASEPLGERTFNDWCCSDLLAASAQICDGPGGGGSGGSYTLDGASGQIGSCGSDVGGVHTVFVGTATRGYAIVVYLGNDRLQATYDGDWFEAMLETVDLRPE